MSTLTAQERLEIREFILDSNLYLIYMSFFILSLTAVGSYFLTIVLLYSDEMDIKVFVGFTILFAINIIVMQLGYSAISKEKEYISRLDTVFTCKEIEASLRSDTESFKKEQE